MYVCGGVEVEGLVTIILLYTHFSICTTESLYTNYVRPSPKNINPFLVSEVKEDPTLELALQALAAETSKRTSRKALITYSVQSVDRYSQYYQSVVSTCQ